MDELRHSAHASLVRSECSAAWTQRRPPPCLSGELHHRVPQAVTKAKSQSFREGPAAPNTEEQPASDKSSFLFLTS